MMEVLGIDIGGSGMKGAIVDTSTGALLGERHRIKTPDPSTPDAMAEVLAAIKEHFNWKGPIGCGMPGPIKNGRLMTANNIDKTWLGVEAGAVFGRCTGLPVKVINDADAAGLAEMEFGAGKGVRGVVIVVTLGTGIGSAVFSDGKLVPNTEFGQLKIRGKKAEHRAAARIREEKDLSWKKWSKRLDEFFKDVEDLIWPDLIVVGGGVSKKSEKFLPLITLRHSQIVPAKFLNEAGIVGAALAGR